MMKDLYTVEELHSIFDKSEEFSTRDTALKLDYRTLEPAKSALIFGKLLLHPSDSITESLVSLYNKTDTDYEVFIGHLRDMGKRHESIVAARWLVGNGRSDQLINEYCIFLFNINYGKTRKIFYQFVTSEAIPPSNLHLVIANILHQGLGLTFTELKHLCSGPFKNLAEHINKLFASKSRIVEDWFLHKKMGLCFYSGESRIILGSLDPIFKNPSVGLEFVNTQAESRFDLGGGFNTSEFERLFGRTFISADIISPNLRTYDQHLIMEDLSESGNIEIVDTERHKVQVEKQSRIQHLQLDVFRHSFPADSNSYLVVSHGFILSAFRPVETVSQPFNNGKYLRTLLSLHGLLRVIELVYLGKDVDFFVVQRTKYGIYKYKTCFVQWRGGKISKLVTTDAQYPKYISTEKIRLTYERINPSNEEFLSYVT